MLVPQYKENSAKEQETQRKRKSTPPFYEVKIMLPPPLIRIVITIGVEILNVVIIIFYRSAFFVTMISTAAAEHGRDIIMTKINSSK